MQIDFLARQAYYVDHLVPLWLKMREEERGDFYYLGADTLARIKKYNLGLYARPYQDEGDCGHNPIICAAYGDAVRAADWDPQRPTILMEHGVGLTFGKGAYADGLGQREKFHLMPVQSNYVLNKVHPSLRKIPHPIVGIPKLDKWITEYKKPHKMPLRPTLGIAFHHGDKNSRPGVVGSAWEHYIEVLPQLAKEFKILLHLHPASQAPLRDLGLDFTEEFDEIMERADIFIGDAGSAAYEFCVTGKPVILLNAPWFDKKMNYGIRFWDYADIGEQVDQPGTLSAAVYRVMDNPNQYLRQRQRMVRDLIPHLGTSAVTAVEAIRASLTKPVKLIQKAVPTSVGKPQQPVSPPVPVVTPEVKIRTSKDQGIVYMCYGQAARKEMVQSIQSLRQTGSDLPIAVVGDGADDIKAPIYPFDATKAEHFQFRAGRVKPFLYSLTPFKETLYVDCDVRFLQRPDAAFGFLKRWDFVIAQERLNLADLYNRKNVNWHHDLEERDYTIEQFGGGTGDFPFWNSGVFFFRKNKKVDMLFKLWYKEWKVYQGWDEQKALMRAANLSDARVWVLGEIWNYPHQEEIIEKVHQKARIILHEYGLGSARSDVKET